MNTQQCNLWPMYTGQGPVGEEIGSTPRLPSMQSHASPVPHDQPFHPTHSLSSQSPPLTSGTKRSYLDHVFLCLVLLCRRVVLLIIMSLEQTFWVWVWELGTGRVPFSLIGMLLSLVKLLLHSLFRCQGRRNTL